MEERLQYDRTYGTMQRFIQQQTGGYDRGNTFGLFQVVLQLRSFCNHGTYQRELAWIPQDILDDEAVPIRNLIRGSHGRCLVCRQQLSTVSHYRSRNNVENCKHISQVCDECAGRSPNQPFDSMGELHCPLCDSLQDSRLQGSSTFGSRQMVGDSSLKLTGESSKMLALLRDVQRESENHKR